MLKAPLPISVTLHNKAAVPCATDQTSPVACFNYGSNFKRNKGPTVIYPKFCSKHKIFFCIMLFDKFTEQSKQYQWKKAYFHAYSFSLREKMRRNQM